MVLTESGKCDESCHHQNWMQIELLLGALGPGKSAAIEDHPEEGENENTDQQNCGQDDDDQVLKPGATVPGAFQIIVVSSVNIDDGNLHILNESRTIHKKTSKFGQKLEMKRKISITRI